MKEILIALDYNPTAQKVAEAGYALAKSMNAQTILLHVVSDMSYYSSLNYSPIMGFDGFTNVYTDTMGEIEGMAQDYLDKSKQHLGDDSIQTMVKNGDYVEAIVTTAKELGVDIIVMGSHGRRGLDKIMIGSVAEKVLRHSLIPLFIIPTRENDESK